MYILELIIKKLTQRLEKPTYDPMQEGEVNENEDYEACEHTFMPIDSTRETLSCTKCGFLVKKSELKNKNFFMK